MVEHPDIVDGPLPPGRRQVSRQRLDRDRDLFIAATSHELRTPVTVIKGYADTLANHWEHLPEEDRREAARVISERAGDLARLVDRLLSAASEADPASGAPPVPFDLVDGLRAAVAALPADLARRLVVQLPAGLPGALGDPASLPTILTELTTNADKYSPVGSPIWLTAGTAAGAAYFRVSDSGIGVRPEYAERVFDRFWQGDQVAVPAPRGPRTLGRTDDDGYRRRRGGAGLGLYLVRRIVERQNGWVSLRPREGGGTVAEVRLPRARAAPSGGAVPGPAGAQAPPPVRSQEAGE
ncbi:hypothetical protein GCM10010124_27080 [Pilimelia terevasa]|uniref:histidine kinase n=1 Tax=Pilimelia terevasa TaxID=53372 RepID=A0A8J3BMX4_9ACTN|nr:hypothetical protein GCM10010124_27080 [Pilimelia terevasa]